MIIKLAFLFFQLVLAKFQKSFITLKHAFSAPHLTNHLFLHFEASLFLLGMVKITWALISYSPINTNLLFILAMITGMGVSRVEVQLFTHFEQPLPIGTWRIGSCCQKKNWYENCVLVQKLVLGTLGNLTFLMISGYVFCLWEKWKWVAQVFPLIVTERGCLETCWTVQRPIFLIAWLCFSCESEQVLDLTTFLGI